MAKRASLHCKYCRQMGRETFKEINAIKHERRGIFKEKKEIRCAHLHKRKGNVQKDKGKVETYMNCGKVQNYQIAV